MAPIGAASVEQVADLFAEPSKDARLGLAYGHGGDPELNGDIGRLAIINGGEPEHLPGAILELAADQL